MGAQRNTATTVQQRPEEADSPSKGELFEALSNRRRRETLRYLLQLDDETTTTKGEVARHIAAREADKHVDEVSADERKRVYIALHQTHLPKLDDIGLVDYDSSQGDVRRSAACEGLDAHLDLETDAEGRPWGLYHVGLGSAGLFLTIVAATGMVALDTGVLLAFTAVFTTLVITAGVAQTYEDPGGTGLGDWLDGGPVDG